MEQKKKKKYKKPTLTTLGTIATLTKFGKTHPGSDLKGGTNFQGQGQ